MASFSKHLLFLLFFVVVIVPIFTYPISITQKNGAQRFHIYPKTTVRIYNYLDGEDFNVHCKSKDDDLRVQVIHDNECFQWEFHPNFWGTTLFFCHLSCTRGAGTYVFYKQKRDFYTRCRGYCDWHVTENGIEGYKEVIDSNGTRQDPKQDTFFKWES